jgi:hypothetical protein
VRRGLGIAAKDSFFVLEPKGAGARVVDLEEEVEMIQYGGCESTAAGAPGASRMRFV